MKKLLITTIATAIASQSFALGIAGKFSTLGAGLELSQAISDNFTIKLNANIADVQLPQSTELKFSMQTTGLLLNYNVWDNIGIEAGGYLINATSNQTIRAQENLGFAVGHVTYNQNVKLDNFAPYLGLTYTSNRQKGFFIGANAGIMIIKSTITNTTSGGITGNFGTYNRIWSDEPQKDTMLYPVIGVNVGYTF